MKFPLGLAGAACALFTLIHGGATHAQPRIDAEAAAYLASPQFNEVLLAGVRRATGNPEGCNGARVHLLEVTTPQEIVMAGARHPQSGLWMVKFEAEGCGAGLQSSLLLRANGGEAPLALPAPTEMHVRLRAPRSGGQSGP